MLSPKKLNSTDALPKKNIHVASHVHAHDLPDGYFRLFTTMDATRMKSIRKTALVSGWTILPTSKRAFRERISAVVKYG